MEEVCVWVCLQAPRWLRIQWYILGLLGVYIRTCVLVFEFHMSVVTVDAALGKKGCS